MLEIAQLVFTTLTGNLFFTSEMGNRCFPMFAKENIAFPFTTYNIGEVPPLSKDARVFPVTISLCYNPDNYTEAIVFADVVKSIFEDLENCEYVNTDPVWDSESQIIIINVNFQITR